VTALLTFERADVTVDPAPLSAVVTAELDKFDRDEEVGIVSALFTLRDILLLLLLADMLE
jgi:hypothetical protein